MLLGIDIGTSGTKAVLVDHEGAELWSAARPTPFAATATGVEADVEAVLAAVSGALADLGDRLAGVVAVGIAGLAESGAPLDAAGRPVGPVIAWHDRRGAEVVARLEERFDDGLSHAIGRRLRTVSSVAKLGWQAAHGSEAVRWWLGVPELCLHRLTGERATDFSLAARTGAYDVVRRAPVPGVPDALGLPEDVFPVPSPAGSTMGTVSAAGAAWSGLPVGIPVTVAGHDHLAGLVGSGAGAGDPGNSVGTTKKMVRRTGVLPDVRAALDRDAAVTVWPDGDGWAVLAGGARAGLVLAAAGAALGGSPADLDALAAGAGTVGAAEWADALAEAVRSGRPHAERLTPPVGPPGAVWNGVLLALAARTWEAAGRVEAVAGPARRLVVFGGGSRSRPWLEAKAAAGHLPVLRSTAGEPVARGAALFAGVAAGWWPSTGAAPRPAPTPV
ncbi:MAG: FGGY-family carbohydrate kinase [Acidimicrobiales bacterium]